MQGAPAERFWQLYVSPGSSSFRLNLAKEPAVTLPCTGPAPSESERSSRERITTLATLDIFSADERMSWNSSLGKRVYSRRRQTFDTRYYIGKKWGRKKNWGWHSHSGREEIHSSAELLYAFNGIHMCIRPHAFSTSSKSGDFKVQIHGACKAS